MSAGGFSANPLGPDQMVLSLESAWRGPCLHQDRDRLAYEFAEPERPWSEENGVWKGRGRWPSMTDDISPHQNGERLIQRHQSNS